MLLHPDEPVRRLADRGLVLLFQNGTRVSRHILASLARRGLEATTLSEFVNCVEGMERFDPGCLDIKCPRGNNGDFDVDAAAIDWWTKNSAAVRSRMKTFRAKFERERGASPAKGPDEHCP